jgi:hypothetical protein
LVAEFIGENSDVVRPLLLADALIARLDRAIQYPAAHIVETNWQYGLPDAPLEAGHDGGGLI